MTGAERKFRWYHRQRRRKAFEEFQTKFHQFKSLEPELSYTEKSILYKELAGLAAKIDRHRAALEIGRMSPPAELSSEEETWLKSARGTQPDFEPFLDQALDDHAIADRIFGKLKGEEK